MSFTALAAASAATLLGLPWAVQGNTVTQFATLKVNEVLYDACGPDAGNEWIEIASTGNADCILNGCQVEREDGTVLFNFPNEVLGSGWTTVIYLGPTRPTIAAKNLTSQKTRVYFTGASSNLLGDSAGGLIVRNATGQILDSVFWGSTAPPTASSGYQQAVAANAWIAGQFYNSSFNGAAPGIWGESIGRRQYAQDTNSSADWSGNGGGDGLGASPGQPNTPDLFGASGLIERAHEVVNGGFLAFSMSHDEGFRYSVNSASMANVVVNDLPGNSYEVVASYDFNVDDQMKGDLGASWTGSIVARFDSDSPRSHVVTTTGELKSPDGDSLNLSNALTRTAGPDGSRTEQESSVVTLSRNGVWTLDVQSTQIDRMTANDTLTRTIQRKQIDWVNASGKHYFTTSVRTRVSESQMQETFSGTMPAAMLPPAPGATWEPLGSVSFVGTGSRVLYGEGTSRFDLQQLDFKLNGSPFASIRAGEPAYLETVRSTGVPGDPVGTGLFTVALPIQMATSGAVRKLALSQPRAAAIQGGKIIVTGTSTIYENGNTVGSTKFFVDPPMQATIGKPPTINPANSVTYYGQGGGGGGGSALVSAAGSTAVVGVCAWAGTLIPAGTAAAPAAAASGPPGWVVIGAAVACHVIGMIFEW